MIEMAFPALCDPATTPKRRLLDLLGRVSEQLGTARQLVVSVGGLDWHDGSIEIPYVALAFVVRRR